MWISGAHCCEDLAEIHHPLACWTDVEDVNEAKLGARGAVVAYCHGTDKCTRQLRFSVTLKNKKRICAVGTTVMRGLESSVSSIGTLNDYDGWTHKFIYPPYDFSLANSMITNFHMPKSTLLMMVSAFGGKDFVMKAYKEAIKKKYNFFSYGDAMMII